MWTGAEDLGEVQSCILTESDDVTSVATVAAKADTAACEHHFLLHYQVEQLLAEAQHDSTTLQHIQQRATH